MTGQTHDGDELGTEGAPAHAAPGHEPVTSASSGASLRNGNSLASQPPVGFILRKLVLLGSHAPPAVLEFARGLNVIAGASDTGKSFAVECIDYLFGAKDRPRSIKQAKAYDKVALEIETADGSAFTLERAFDSAKVQWYPAAFDAIGPDTKFETLAAQHNSKSTRTLSYRLLELTGLAGRRLRENKRNETRTVSFRSVAKLVVVDELRIITIGSPAFPTQDKREETAERSLFGLLLTGRDDTGLVAQPDIADSRLRLVAQADLLDRMIGPSPAPGAPPTLAPAELARQRTALQQHVDTLAVQAEQEARAIDDARVERGQVLERMQRERSRLIVVEELLSRFALLRRSYESDLQRLAFVAEGHHYFAQLAAVTCPTCSRSLDDDNGAAAHAFCVQGTPLADDVQAACASEAAKIRTHLRDLDGTVADLTAERTDLAASVEAGQARYLRIEDTVQREFRPRLLAVTQELRASIAQRDTVVQMEAELAHRGALVDAKLDVERALASLAANPVAVAVKHDVPYQEFAETVRDLLRAWQYPGAETAAMDEKAMDVVIDGESRASHGKGVRAIMYAAFLLGLMHFCRARKLPHPGFLVLDSPVTAYKPRDRGQPAEAGDQTSGRQEGEEDVDIAEAPEDLANDRAIAEGMQGPFFEYLANTAAEIGEQVIVFENKEPPPDVRDRISYVYFTGTPGVGRPGFIPA